MKYSVGFLLAIFFTFLNSTLSHAQFLEWHWSITEGDEQNEFITAVDTDIYGNIYVVGGFSGTLDFFGEVIVSNGGNDVFMASFDPSGTFRWVKYGGGHFEDIGKDIAISSEYVYVTGGFTDQAIFEDETLTSSGAMDVYLLKYNTSGELLWATQGGSVTDDIGNSVSVDETGNIYLTGDINYVAKFGDHSVSHFGFTDIFIAKYTSDGSCTWAKSAGGQIYDYGACIETINGHVFVSGAFNDYAEFDSEIITSVDFVDVFIAHYLSDGSLVEVISAGGTNNENIGCMAVDDNLNVYIGGWYLIDIGIGEETLTSIGGADIFVAKFEPGNGFRWAESFGGIEDDEAQAISMGWIAGAKNEVENTFIIAGTFENEAYFQEHTLVSQGFDDGFILQQNTDGNVEWASQIGGAGTLRINDCIARELSDCLFVGDFVEELRIGYKTYNTVGGYDLFIANLGHGNNINEDELITGLELHPNPVNQRLMIEYRLKDKSRVSFKITDITGRVIKEVNDTHKLSGTHHKEINTSSLQPGSYLFNINTDKSTITKKLIKL